MDKKGNWGILILNGDSKRCKPLDGCVVNVDTRILLLHQNVQNVNPRTLYNNCDLDR